MICLAALLVLPACNDEFLEKRPVVSQTEASFRNYNNFLTYSWKFYDFFTQHTNNVQNWANSGQMFNADGDLLACYLTSAEDNDVDMSRRSRTITVPETGGGWNFDHIRMINIMDRNIDGSDMTVEDKKHWRAFCYFFFCYRYMELVSRFGDVPWINRVLKDDGSDDDIIYGTRTPRKVVTDSIMKRLQWAERNIKVNGEGAGTNTINKACVQYMISRFGLFEGTWRKYHGLGDYAEFLNESVRASEALMQTYPTLDNNFDELVCNEDLSKRPGTILFCQFDVSLEWGSISNRYERSTATYYGMHRATADMYLVKSNGLPVTHPANAARPDIDMYDEFRDRDPRLLLSVAPPYSQPIRLVHNNPGIPDYPFPPLLSSSSAYTYNTNANYQRPGLDNQEYIRLLENILPNKLSKRLPAFQFQGTAMIWSVPNFPSSPTTQFRSKSGYICWRNYALWDITVPTNNGNQSESDKPIFFIEEILLNYAEAKWELGQFTQGIADQTINRLRRRTTINMPDMIIANIDASTDPSNPADKVTPGRDPDVDPVLWEIRRERMVELMGLGYGFADIRRWKKGPWFYNRPIIGAKMDKKYYLNLDNQGNVTTTTPVWVNNLPLVKKDFSSLAAGETQGYIRRFDDPSKGGKGWDDAFYLFPIPKDDLTLNPKLGQNPGWEKY